MVRVRIVLVALVVACGTASPSSDTSTETTGTTSTTQGGATWQDVPTSGDPDTSTSTTSGSGVSEVGPFGESSTTDKTSSSGESTSGPIDPGTSSSGGMPPSECYEMACGLCATCTVEAECAQVANNCAAIDGCEAAATCLVTCGVGGPCQNDCCDGMTIQAIDAAFLVYECVEQACAAACQDYAPGACD